MAGFFAVPYTIVLYPIIFIFMARLWSVSHRHGYVTTADFVRGRYDSRGLSLAVAVTGFVATMPYIALQLVGIQAVLEVAGLGGGDNVIAKDAPLFIAFAVLAAYTYSSGLRAPAVIAFVKDILIYLVIIVAVIYLPGQVGGWDAIFGSAQDKMAATNEATGKPTGAFIPGVGAGWAYATLALGSALALFMYPHSVTASLSSNSRNTIRRNAAILPAYSFVLGLLALLGWVAIAAGTQPIGLDGEPNAQLVIPQLFEDMFPAWFAGVAFAAIAIGALVPAAIMSIAAANTFSRNIYKEWLKPDATPAQEAKVSKLMSLIVKAFALRLRAHAGQAERDQLPAPRRHLDPPDLPRGGVQPLHALVPPLRRCSPAGRSAMVYGTVEAYQVVNPVTGKHFGGSLALIPGIEQMGYIAMTAFTLNVVDRGRPQRGPQRGQGVQRSGRDHRVRLLGRRRRPARPEGPGRARHARGRVRRRRRHPGQRRGALSPADLPAGDENRGPRRRSGRRRPACCACRHEREATDPAQPRGPSSSIRSGCASSSRA